MLTYKCEFEEFELLIFINKPFSKHKYYRALYSRAKHIFMDDILSAVDAHTARHIMDKCILGPLMEGRTRILVTHHVQLCLAGANYLVRNRNFFFF